MKKFIMILILLFSSLHAQNRLNTKPTKTKNDITVVDIPKPKTRSTST
jgi:hypothetical protein